MAQTWDNEDGLHLEYGIAKTVISTTGEPRTVADDREIDLKITLANLTETETIIDNNVFFPKSCIPYEIKIITETAAATGAAIDLGLIKMDRTTEYDYDGLLAAFPTASMNAAGETVIITDNTTYDGAKIGAVITEPCYLSISRTTSTAFTDGVVHIRIKYYRP